MNKNKSLLLLIAASLLTGAMVGCAKKPSSNGSSPYDPDDPSNSISGGSIVKDSDFSRALSYNYDNFTLVYDQLYNDETIEEYGYIYHVDGISYLLDYGNVETSGFRYLYYSTYQNDGYMYWQKSEGYVYDGWISNGYRDSDLAMYNAYFDLHRFLSIITPDDVDYILGGFYVKESSMRKYDAMGLEFFGDPFFGGEEITAIAFFTDKETGAITKIVGSCDERSDNGFQIEIGEFGTTSVPQNAISVKAPYYNSDSDRNIYTYQEMLGDAYVEDVWPTNVTLSVVGEVEKEAGYDAVVDISESVELAYDLAPENVNRVEFEWVNSNKNVVDLDYKANFTKHHKFATGVEEGEATISIKVQLADKTWKESNKLKIKVKPLKQQDKTNAVYDLTITGASYAKDANGNEDKNTTIFSAYNAVETTAKFSIKAHNATAYEAKNSDSFGTSGMIMVVSPAAQEYMNNGFYSEVVFDFGDQQVVDLEFYYGLYKSNQRGGAISNMASAYISTSNDGINWSDPIDMKEEMQYNFQNVNLDYEAPIKLMSRSFAKASKVKLYFKANMVGNNYWIAMNNFVFSNDSTCHNHESNVIDVTKVNATASALKVKVDDTIQFGATVEPENATYSNVTWISTNPAVGTINPMGVFTGVSEGTTTVYASAHNGVESEKFEITVIGQEYLDEKYVGKQYLAEEKYASSQWWDYTLNIVSTSSATLTLKNDSETTTINFTYYTKDESTRPWHTFKGENNEVLDVKFYDDKVEIFLRNSILELGNEHTGYGEDLKLYVRASSIEIRVDSKPVSEKTVQVGDKFAMFAEVKPATAYYKAYTATSNNTAAVTVTPREYGGYDVTAVGAGEATITVKNNDNVSATLKVTVLAPVGVTSIALNATRTTFEVGETATVTATLNAGVTSKKLVWSVNNANATIKTSSDTLSATVTGSKAGSVVVTCTDTLTNVSESITLTINASTAGIDLKYVGTYSGEDVAGQLFEFTVLPSGKANFVSYDWYDEVICDTTFSLMATPTAGNEVSFVCDEDSDFVVSLRFSGSQCYCEIEDENYFSGLYLDGSMFVTKA